MHDLAPIAYAHRPKPFGFEVSYRLDPDGLFVDTGRKQETVPYRSIASARLAYAPTNFTTKGYRLALRLADGRTLKLGNLSWKTFFEFDRQDRTYAPFVRALLARAAAANPRLACRTGTPPVLWALSAAAGALAVAGLLAMGFAASQRGGVSAALLVALFVAPLGWQVHAMTMRNWPGSFDPGAPPERVMPAAG
ncbi:hypothetical protein ABEG18_16395 [Alsobacter sp. KACC 23698]|uniref:DUF2812 domain-containing protein n=1 Tax=Alsobacter sp. KACC 23698 TaxID=3149229 RepID=A0AAU7JAB4_9HYPH